MRFRLGSRIQTNFDTSAPGDRQDKIVQRAVVDVLNAIYDEDFLGFSYGFRPKRSQHDALDAHRRPRKRGVKVFEFLSMKTAKHFHERNGYLCLGKTMHRLGDEKLLVYRMRKTLA